MTQASTRSQRTCKLTLMCMVGAISITVSSPRLPDRQRSTASACRQCMSGMFPLKRLNLRGGCNTEDAEGMRETMRRKRIDDEEKMLAVSAESALELESRYEEQALYRAEQQQRMLASGDGSSFRDANLSLPFGNLGNESSIRNAALEELDERIARLRASDTESGARKQRNEGHRKEVGQNRPYAPAESARTEPAEYGPLGEILGNHYLSGEEREGESGWEEEEEDAEALERARALIAEGLPRVPGLEEMRADIQQATPPAPPPPSRTNWTRLVAPTVLTGHIYSRLVRKGREQDPGRKLDCRHRRHHLRFSETRRAAQVAQSSMRQIGQTLRCSRRKALARHRR